MDLKFIKDVDAEQIMNANSIEWFTQDVDLRLIQTSESVASNARFTSIDSGVVKRYEDAMKAGCTFPMMVVVQLKDHTYRMVGGNHRMRAMFNCCVDSAECYVIFRDDSSEFSLRLIDCARELNLNHGLNISTLERMSFAIDLVKNGMGVDDAAKRYGVERGKLQAKINIGETRRKLLLHGLEPKAFKEFHLEHLSKIKDAKYLLHYANIIHKCAPVEKEIRPAIESFVAARSAMAREKIADQYAKSATLTSAKNMPQSKPEEIATFRAFIEKLTNLHLMLSAGRNGESYTNYRQLKCPTSKIAETDELIHNVAEMLYVIAGAEQ
jgi:hypothetical protein